MATERCFYCGRFLSIRVWVRNWMVIQAPGVADPEPYEIQWCDRCSKSAPIEDEEWGPDSAQQQLERGPA